jgi:hypothetical protein
MFGTGISSFTSTAFGYCNWWLVNMLPNGWKELHIRKIT